MLTERNVKCRRLAEAGGAATHTTSPVIATCPAMPVLMGIFTEWCVPSKWQNSCCCLRSTRNSAQRSEHVICRAESMTFCTSRPSSRDSDARECEAVRRACAHQRTARRAAGAHGAGTVRSAWRYESEECGKLKRKEPIDR